MNKLLDKIFGFQKRLDEHEVHVRYMTEQAINKQREVLKRISETAERDFFVGLPVIYFSNEIEDPVIGFGSRVDFITKSQNPVLVISDYISFEDRIIFGTPMVFSPELFEAMYKLTEFERIHLLHHSKSQTVHYGSEANRNNVVRSKHEILKVLQARGFFSKYIEYINSKEKKNG